MTWNGTGKASSSTSSIEPRSAARSRIAVDERLDPRPQALDRRRREGQRHQPPQPGVVRRVEVQDALGRSPARAAGAAARGAPARRVVGLGRVGLDVARELVAAQRAHDVVVAGEHDEAERRHVDRVGSRRRA